MNYAPAIHNRAVQDLLHNLSYERMVKDLDDLQLILDVLLGQDTIEDPIIRHLLDIAQSLSKDARSSLRKVHLPEMSANDNL